MTKFDQRYPSARTGSGKAGWPRGVHVVAGLARKAGAPASYIDRWRKFIADWPHHERDQTLANEAQFLIDWADDLSRVADER
jgi:hypothetical protein